MSKNSRAQRQAHARLMKKQLKEAEAGKLTNESWPFDSFSEPFREKKDGPEFITINWVPTKEPLTTIAHLPASEIKKNWPQFQQYSDNEVYEILLEKIKRNQIIEQNMLNKEKNMFNKDQNQNDQ